MTNTFEGSDGSGEAVQNFSSSRYSRQMPRCSALLNNFGKSDFAAHMYHKLPHLLGALITSSMARHAKMGLLRNGRQGCEAPC